MSGARGRVWSEPPRKGRRRLWLYEVTVNGVVIDTDNTCNFARIVTQCDEVARAAERVARIGHTFRPYAELVERASL